MISCNKTRSSSEGYLGNPFGALVSEIVRLKQEQKYNSDSLESWQEEQVQSPD